MRTFEQLTEDEQRRAIDVRLHELAHSARWPNELRQSISKFVGDNQTMKAKPASDHIHGMVKDFFRPQAEIDVRVAFFPDAGELVIVLDGDCTATINMAASVHHESTLHLDKRIREAAEQRVLGNTGQMLGSIDMLKYE